MDRLLNATTGLSIAILILVLFSVRRQHIRVEYSITWLAAAVCMLVLSRSRPFLDAVRAAVGLPDSPLALFLVGSSFFIVMFFRFSMIVSTLRDNNIALAQRVAILECRLRGLEEDRP